MSENFGDMRFFKPLSEQACASHGMYDHDFDATTYHDKDLIMGNRLHSITLKGFKSIQELDEFGPSNLTALIGPNGSGKSNFISFFRMMSWMLADSNNLQIYIAELGGASKLLHDGPDTTREIEAELTIQTDAGENQYAFRMFYAAGDTLIFADERYRFSRTEHGHDGRANWIETGAGHRGPQLLERTHTDETARVIHGILQRIIVHQFHNTSDTARMRTKWLVSDNRYLKEDAANIAPILLRLRLYSRNHYTRIVETIRLILPFFSDFDLKPENGYLLLAWRERNSDLVFDVSQASDGMLRVVALVTLLLQPTENLPDVLILDEPELGLHPYAINIIGGLIASVSMETQVIVATQSMALIDCFEPEDIVVVEREGRASRFSKLDVDALNEWLDDYSLSELWEKNVVGGRP